MRTIRIKLYRLSELAPGVRGLAIEQEAKRFIISISGGSSRNYYNHNELEAAEQRLLKNKIEFTEGGENVSLLIKSITI